MIPVEKLKLVVKWFNWENNENLKQFKSGSLEDSLKELKSALGQFNLK